MVIRTRIEYCGPSNNYNCVYSTVVKTTIKVKTPSETHKAARPPKNSDSVFVRSAITFDSFNGSVSKFNSTAFKFAVMDALSTDRLQYSPGSEKGRVVRKVKTKDVSVIVVDQWKKLYSLKSARRGRRQ